MWSSVYYIVEDSQHCLSENLLINFSTFKCRWMNNFCFVHSDCTFQWKQNFLSLRICSCFSIQSVSIQKKKQNGIYMRFGISSDYSSCFQINQLEMRQFELQLISERKNWMAAIVRSFFEFTRCKNNSFSQINENKYFMHNIVLVLWNTIREFDFFSRKESCKVFFSTKSILHFKKWFSDMFFRMNRTIKKNIFSAILPNVLCEC